MFLRLFEVSLGGSRLRHLHGLLRLGGLAGLFLPTPEGGLRHLDVLLRRPAVGILRQDVAEDGERLLVTPGRVELLAFVEIAPELRHRLFAGGVHGNRRMRLGRAAGDEEPDGEEQDGRRANGDPPEQAGAKPFGPDCSVLYDNSLADKAVATKQAKTNNLDIGNRNQPLRRPIPHVD